MIIQFHTPKGIVVVDTDTITDAKLAKIGMDRRKLDDFLAEQPRDLVAEIDGLKERIKELEKK